MSKITTEHLARGAYVYIRQSTADQLTHNHESRRRQYALANRARQLGWTTVEVIDDDLGRSGGGIARPGFERLLAAICEARVGAVLAIEASRLARNGRDWHTLIEFCGLVGTVIVDEDGIYDPRHPNDRLLLGMKGTMSELELSLFRQRSQEALKQKARRGALILGVAAGYVKIGRDRIEKNPDQRVQDALQLVFSKFAEFQSARQVHIWLRDEGIELPVKSRNGDTRDIIWRLPAYNIVHNILTNPTYAGAYAFGRTTSKISVEQGRKRVRRGVHRPMTEWDVLIKDHHEPYITWDEFERNQRVIANNATGKGSAMAKGAVRRGELLLPGLLRCGHCGRKLHVSYSGKLGRYSCYGARTNHGTARCISISGLSIDAAVSAEVLRILKPLGTDAAVRAINAQTHETSAAQRQLELSLQQARYEAAHARRQYDAVDPANRLVAGELERRWNEALQTVRRLEAEIGAVVAAKPPLGEREREQLIQLGADLDLAWSHPAATAATRKRILRTALNEIVVRKEGAVINMVLHWQGGHHTALQVQLRLNAAGRHHWPPPENTVALVRELARLMPDRQIARLLNRSGKPTGYGNGWTEQRVRGFRKHHDIASYQDGEWSERGEITLDAAAQIIGVTKMTALRMIRRGQLKGRQACKGAPWVIKAEDAATFAGLKRLLGPVTPNPAQQTFDFQ
ncbi:MAG TPA: recombinase family protein [Casimicrobiaceae bacterium]|jgi:DNA invertase Pin-like site-specific DNA recombinase|nr:recombinase family protein [Casimicrobiaceae bacterium]